MAGVCAGPVRHLLARREVTWLDRQWQTAQEDESGRITVQRQLEAYVLVGAQAQVDPAVVALYLQERSDLLALAGRLRRALLVDHGLSILRGDMVSELTLQGALLKGSAASSQQPTSLTFSSDTDAQSEADDVRVDNALSAELAHWGEQPPASPPPGAYPSARAVLARLSRWSQQPTGTVLLAAPSSSSDQMVRLDVDASRMTLTEVPAEGSPTPRQGYLAYEAGGIIWAVAPDGSGVPRRLIDGDLLFAAVDRGDIWVVKSTTGQVTEVDDSGTSLAGPLLPPGLAEAATSSGLLVGSAGNRPGMEVWNPANGRVGCRFALDDGQAVAVAVQGNFVVWTGGDGRAHVTNIASCSDVLVEPTDGGASAVDSHGHLSGELLQAIAGVSAAAAFSPDGRYVAVAYAEINPDGSAGYPFLLVDTTTGRVSTIPTPASVVPSSASAAAAAYTSGPVAGPVNGIAWSTDDRRLFWLYPSTGGDPAVLMTWRIGDAASVPLRAVDLLLSGPLYTIS